MKKIIAVGLCMCLMILSFPVVTFAEGLGSIFGDTAVEPVECDYEMDFEIGLRFTALQGGYVHKIRMYIENDNNKSSDLKAYLGYWSGEGVDYDMDTGKAASGAWFDLPIEPFHLSAGGDYIVSVWNMTEKRASVAPSLPPGNEFFTALGCYGRDSHSRTFSKIDEVIYIDVVFETGDMNDVMGEINRCASPEEVNEVFEKYSGVLKLNGLFMDEYGLLSLNLRKEICKYLLDGGMSYDQSTLKETFNTVVVMKALNSSAGWENVKRILDAYQGMFELESYLGVGYEKIPANRKSYAYKEIYARIPYGGADGVLAPFKTGVLLGELNNFNSGTLAKVLEDHSAIMGLDTNDSYKYYKGLDSVGQLYVNDILTRLNNEGGKTFTDREFKDFTAAFEDAVKQQKDNAATPPVEKQPTGGGGGGGGGGGSGAVNIVKANQLSEPVPTLPPEENTSESKPAPPVEETPAFNDIGDALWAAESITYLAKANVLNGRAEGIFEPNALVTREEFIKILISAFGLLDSTASCEFFDVSESDWMYPYLASAISTGVTRGSGGGYFGVGQEISRQDAAVFVYRLCRYKNIRLNETNNMLEFSDKAQVSEYAEEAVTAMQKSRIINGVGNNRFAPLEPMTRAQAAKIIYETLKMQ